MTRQILNKGSTHYVVKLMIYCVILVKRQSIVKLQLTKIYCTSFYGSVLWDLDHPAINAFCATWRKSLRRVSGVPYCTHSSLLPVMSSYLPLLDELCCRSALFIKSCLESIVSTVARYGIYYGRMNSHLGRNAFFLLFPL